MNYQHVRDLRAFKFWMVLLRLAVCFVLFVRILVQVYRQWRQGHDTGSSAYSTFVASVGTDGENLV